MGLGKTLSMLSLVLKKKGDSQDVRKWLAKPPAVEGRRGEREERELERQEDGGGGRCGIAVSHVLTNSSIFKFGPTFFTLSIGSP